MAKIITPDRIQSVVEETLQVDGGPPKSKALTARRPKPNKKAAPVQAPQQQKYIANIYPGSNQPLPDKFAEAVLSLEQSMSMPIFLLVHGDPKIGLFDVGMASKLLALKSSIPENKRVAVLLDSPGGSAKDAYQMATILRNHCGGFDVLIPRYAKSAATLFSLGADNLVLDRDAEIGPLDAQYLDTEREHPISALDEVQSLERLHAFALEAVDRSMLFIANRSGKKIETLLPKILDFVTNIMHPLIQKIDTVHYTKVSRDLKVAEEYAIRLLQKRYPKDKATAIARHLVENYPEHGFFIDGSEASTFGLKTIDFRQDQKAIIQNIRRQILGVTAFGMFQTLQEKP